MNTRMMLMAGMLSVGVATGFNEIRMPQLRNTKIEKRQTDAERNEALAKAEAKRLRKAELKVQQLKKANQCNNQTSSNS